MKNKLVNKSVLALPLFDDFLLSLKTNNFSDETVYCYERDLILFSIFLCNDVKIDFDSITKLIIDKYKAYLTSRDRITANGLKTQNKLSANSVNRMLSSLRRYFKYLIDIDYNTPIAPESIKLLKLPKHHARVAELDMLVKLIEFPSNFEKDRKVAIRNRAMLETLFATGMRISELLSINKDQIDKTGRIFIKGKGRKERFVYLTDRAQEYLKEYINIRDDQRPALFLPHRGLNSSTSKARISTNYLQMKIKQYRELIGINVPTSAHSLRHGFATYLAESGANPAAIQILLGHESLATTTRYVNTSDRYAEKTHKTYHPLKKK